MKCPTCEGTGEIYEYGINYLDGDSCLCYNCHGTGVVFSLSDPQSWDEDHPGWGRFEGHVNSKWKTRFVVSGCESPIKIVEFLFEKTGIEYNYLNFSEDNIFPGEDEAYMIPCVYFFPSNERDLDENITKAELTEIYWY